MERRRTQDFMDNQYDKYVNNITSNVECLAATLPQLSPCLSSPSQAAFLQLADMLVILGSSQFRRRFNRVSGVQCLQTCHQPKDHRSPELAGRPNAKSLESY